MEWFFIGCFIIVVVVIAILCAIGDSKAAKQRFDEKEETIKRQLISKTPIDYTPTKAIDVLISADFKTAKWRPEIYDNCRTFGFDEIAGFELIENGEVIATTTTKTKGGISRAVVGGMVAGGIGAVVGASTAKKKSHTTERTVITSRSVRISLTNPDVNQIDIDIPEHMEYHIITKEGRYTVSFEEVGKEIISMLESIVAAAEKIEAAKSFEETDHAVKQIREYKQLLDEGIITQEDFDTKKKQLLGI